MSRHEVTVDAAEDLETPVGAARVADAVRHVLAAERAGPAEISVALVADDEITRLNRDYLSHDGPTDVIAFPLRAPDDTIVGDVYVGVEQARRQAAELGVPPDEEVLRLAVHGTLHVLGHDHPDAADLRGDSPMYRRQEALLAEILQQGATGG